MRAHIVAVALLFCATLTLLRAQPPAANIILTNGKIITVDERFTIAEAMAVRGERIVYDAMK